MSVYSEDKDALQLQGMSDKEITLFSSPDLLIRPF